MDSNKNPILLFDGYCNLCNNSVQFVLNHEKNTDLVFTSLQSEAGISLLKQYNINPLNLDSLVFIKNNKFHTKSSAALSLTPYLRGLYPLLYSLLIIPPFIRNTVYDYIARNRYKWYGKAESCMMPTKELMNRFL